MEVIVDRWARSSAASSNNFITPPSYGDRAASPEHQRQQCPDMGGTACRTQLPNLACHTQATQ